MSVWFISHCAPWYNPDIKLLSLYSKGTFVKISLRCIFCRLSAVMKCLTENFSTNDYKQTPTNKGFLKNGNLRVDLCRK